jgi:hypothetical protein
VILVHSGHPNQNAQHRIAEYGNALRFSTWCWYSAAFSVWPREAGIKEMHFVRSM